MAGKRCVTCHDVKPHEQFNVRRSSQDGRQDRCRDCCKRWYLEHRVEHMRVARLGKRRVRDEYRERMAAFLLKHPCVDCGESDIRLLEFDHRPGSVKVEAVAILLMRQVPWRRIEAEIAKCDARCANCHRKQTAERGGHWRHRYLITRAADALADECRRALGTSSG